MEIATTVISIAALAVNIVLLIILIKMYNE